MIVPEEYQISEAHKYYLKNMRIGQQTKPSLSVTSMFIFNKYNELEKQECKVVLLKPRGRL